MGPPCTEVSQEHQLPFTQWQISDMLVMGPLSATSSLLQAFPCTFKSHLQSGLVLLNPLMNGPTNRTLNSTQQEIYWPSRLRTLRKRETLL